MRVRNEALSSENPFEWHHIDSSEIFAGRKIVVVALPGAFTPACSESHLPGYERDYDAYKELGIDEVYCTSVNDAFVMFQWAKALNISDVKMLPDGNGEFAEKLDMLVERTAQGMGRRSWRYSMYVEDGQIVKTFSEPDKTDNPSGVPVNQSASEIMLNYLQKTNG